MIHMVHIVVISVNVLACGMVFITLAAAAMVAAVALILMPGPKCA